MNSQSKAALQQESRLLPTTTSAMIGHLDEFLNDLNYRCFSLPRHNEMSENRIWTSFIIYVGIIVKLEAAEY